MKYTSEVLRAAVKESKSVASVLRLIGARPSGGLHKHISRRLKYFSIDTSHFTGKAANSGDGHVGGPRKLSWNEILVYDRRDSRKEDSFKLRRAMLESGIPYVCFKCNALPVWNGGVLTLEAEHKNGNNLDNRRDNLGFICPNCHSQTDTFRSKNRKDI
jgi:hypothetical protein